VAVYNRLSVEAGGGDNTYSNKLGPLNAAADECWAGGANSTDMVFWQVWNNYTLSGAVGPQATFWKIDYEGIYRANLLLQKIQGIFLILFPENGPASPPKPNSSAPITTSNWFVCSAISR
jgi:hypothetical protein